MLCNARRATKRDVTAGEIFHLTKNTSLYLTALYVAGMILHSDGQLLTQVDSNLVPPAANGPYPLGWFVPIYHNSHCGLEPQDLHGHRDCSMGLEWNSVEYLDCAACYTLNLIACKTHAHTRSLTHSPTHPPTHHRRRMHARTHARTHMHTTQTRPHPPPHTHTTHARTHANTHTHNTNARARTHTHTHLFTDLKFINT